MIKLVASDLDGTIIDNDNLINANNYKAINDINNKKINFVICTGKTYPIIKGMCSKISASYGIFGNGNQIINLKTGEEIYKKLLSKEEINTCINIAKSNNLHVHCYTDSEVISEKLLYMDLRNYVLMKNNKYPSSMSFKIVDNIQEYINNSPNINISKLVISSPTHLSKIQHEISNKLDVSVIFINKTGKYIDSVINTEYEYLDISPKGVSKSSALKILGNYLNIDSKEMMAIGDNLNDVEMIKNSGIGIAVANAYDELKSVATYTTKNPVETGGFAEAVYKYIEF